MGSEPLAGFRLSLAIALVVAPACDRSSDVVRASAQSAPVAPEGLLTARFADVTEKFYTGQIQLKDLLELSEPILRMERGEPVHEPWIRRAIDLPYEEALRADLVVLPETPEGVKEYQVQIQGPVTSGLFQQDADRRTLTISFGFDAAGEPLFCVGLMQDTIVRTSGVFERYQNLFAAPVGGVYKIGKTESDSYWRPITLRAELLSPEEVDPETAKVAEDSPGRISTWEYVYGKKGPSAPGRLSDIALLHELMR